MGMKKYDHPFLGEVRTHEDTLLIPLKWTKPRTIFVNSMSDLFHADVPFDFIDKVFAIMSMSSRHTYIIATKRPERAAEYFASKTRKWSVWQEAVILEGKSDHEFNWPLPNVWMLTSVEDQKTAAQRIPYLLQCDAVVKGISAEPLLGPIDLTNLDCDGAGHPDYCQINALTGVQTDMARPCRDVPKLNWVIAGGESGIKSGVRPPNPEWFASLRDQCASAGVAFFFKQWGQWAPVEVASLLTSPENDLLKVFDWSFVLADGRYTKTPQLSDLENKIFSVMYRVGKHNSGNELEGEQHLQYPQI
jgi:protein gp37